MPIKKQIPTIGETTSKRLRLIVGTTLTIAYLTSILFLSVCENKESKKFCSMRKDMCFTPGNYRLLREYCPETCGYCRSTNNKSIKLLNLLDNETEG